MVIEDVVELATELQAETFGQSERLVEVHIQVPVVRRDKLVTIRIGSSACSVGAAGVKQTGANRHALRVSIIGNSDIVFVRRSCRQRDVVESVVAHRYGVSRRVE